MWFIRRFVWMFWVFAILFLIVVDDIYMLVVNKFSERYFLSVIIYFYRIF